MSKKKSNGALLDTHTWIWLFGGSPELSKETIDNINNWGKQGKVFISAISVWELSMLVAKQRIILSQPVSKWVKDSFQQPGINLVDLSPEIAIESSFLPGKIHGDPADRIICATSRIKNLTLFTRDQKILEYSKTKHLNCYCV